MVLLIALVVTDLLLLTLNLGGIARKILSKGLGEGLVEVESLVGEVRLIVALGDGYIRARDVSCSITLGALFVAAANTA